MEYLINAYLVATSLISVASIVCSYTSTPKDDAIVAKAYKLMETFAFLGGKAKQQGCAAVEVLSTIGSLWPIFISFITLVIVLAKLHADQETLKEKVKVLFDLWNKNN